MARLSCGNRGTKDDLRSPEDLLLFSSWVDNLLILCHIDYVVHTQESKMKQNITLSIEKDIIKKGKLIAAQKGTSLSKMLSEHLKQTIDKEEQYEAAKRSALHALKNGFHLGGKITWRREDLYGR